MKPYIKAISRIMTIILAVLIIEIASDFHYYTAYFVGGKKGAIEDRAMRHAFSQCKGLPTQKDWDECYDKYETSYLRSKGY